MGRSLSESSLDSIKIRGEDDPENLGKSAVSPSRVKFEKAEIDADDSDYRAPDSSTKMSEVRKKERQVPNTVQIKVARIDISNSFGEIQSVLSRHDILKLSDTVNELTGIVDCQVKTDCHPNIAVVSYKTNGTPLRNIVAKIKELGYP